MIESNCKTFLKLQHLCLKITNIPIPTLMLQLTPKERDLESNHLIKPSAVKELVKDVIIYNESYDDELQESELTYV